MVVVGEASFKARFNAPDSQIADFLEGETDLFRKLPPDIFRYIMRKLQLECIIRCKCVCKSWRNLIEIGFFYPEEEIWIMKIRRFIIINAVIGKIKAERKKNVAVGESKLWVLEEKIKDKPMVRGPMLVVGGSTIVVIAIAVGCFIFGVRKRSV
ncbi:uncharacterized protein LOC121754299 [Salvia splendens]|uniref:uncharacterized protein LOC121754299 n=1 Tax=Salvia splendens TaxID=180675 RepID=UPI001C26ECFD|nr:uncharacterized protein LOC121754299 [Salvia splendens]XP_042005612.1 uncharacterized protein LOC121754299 [Salvia splendens]